MIKSSYSRIVIKSSAFVILCIGILTSCTMREPQSTPLPGQLRFTPESTSSLRIEFDYPADWVLNHYDDAMHNDHSIRVFELTRVTPTPGCCTSIKEGIIWLDEVPVDNPEVSIENQIHAIYGLQKKVGTDGLFADKDLLNILIEESTLTVDGKTARKIVNIVVRKSSDGSIERTRTEDIYVPAKGKYYCFTLVISDERRNEPFGKAFDDLIASIHFVP